MDANGETLQKVLTNRQASESDRMVAADLAGEIGEINDELAATLLAIAASSEEPEELRAVAAISLGPALEEADMAGFDDPFDESSITEETFATLQESLHRLYLDQSIPKQVRRRILEASVRAPQAWHEGEIRSAYAGGDREWMLTAVFGMRFVPGFDQQILEALKNPDPEIHLEAVRAAGDSELDGAWQHVAALVADPNTEKYLLIAAIEAAGSIRPGQARKTLARLARSRDEDIAFAVDEAIMMAEAGLDVG